MSLNPKLLIGRIVAVDMQSFDGAVVVSVSGGKDSAVLRVTRRG